VITCNDNDIENRIKNSSLTIVQFSASWCMPCKILKTKIEKVAAETPDVTFIYCDIEATTDFSQKSGIMSVPTVIAYYDGQAVDQVVGSDEKNVRDLVENLLSRVKTRD
jgi:thioredoxin 1